MLNCKNKHSKKGFTVIELIFVIVLVSILSAVAIPRFAATRDDASIVKGRSEVSTIRSAIMSKRQQNILSGKGAKYITAAKLSQTNLFDGVLTTPIYAKADAGGWSKVGEKYFFQITSNDNSKVEFTYNPTNGTFDCDHSEEKCRNLTE